jgi:hypothetical protein
MTSANMQLDGARTIEDRHDKDDPSIDGSQSDSSVVALAVARIGTSPSGPTAPAQSTLFLTEL